MPDGYKYRRGEGGIRVGKSLSKKGEAFDKRLTKLLERLNKVEDINIPPPVVNKPRFDTEIVPPISRTEPIVPPRTFQIINGTYPPPGKGRQPPLTQLDGELGKFGQNLPRKPRFDEELFPRNPLVPRFDTEKLPPPPQFWINKPPRFDEEIVVPPYWQRPPTVIPRVPPTVQPPKYNPPRKQDKPPKKPYTPPVSPPSYQPFDQFNNDNNDAYGTVLNWRIATG